MTEWVRWRNLSYCVSVYEQFHVSSPSNLTTFLCPPIPQAPFHVLVSGFGVQLVANARMNVAMSQAFLSVTVNAVKADGRMMRNAS